MEKKEKKGGKENEICSQFFFLFLFSRCKSPCTQNALLQHMHTVEQITFM